MKNGILIIVVLLAAILLGTVSYYCFAGWYNIIPWAIAALITGYLSGSRRRSMVNGAIFGYVLFLVYIYMGYGGKTDAASMLHFILFDVLISLLGLVSGLIGSFMGNLLKGKILK